MTDYPEPARSARRAWARQKARDRALAQARFKAGSTRSIQKLEAMLPTATPIEAEAINARIADTRARNQAQRASWRATRAAADRAARLAAERDQDARLNR